VNLLTLLIWIFGLNLSQDLAVKIAGLGQNQFLCKSRIAFGIQVFGLPHLPFLSQSLKHLEGFLSRLNSIFNSLAYIWVTLV